MTQPLDHFFVADDQGEGFLVITPETYRAICKDPAAWDTLREAARNARAALDDHICDDEQA